jgi:hypothetical protein
MGVIMDIIITEDMGLDMDTHRVSYAHFFNSNIQTLWKILLKEIKINFISLSLPNFIPIVMIHSF